MTREGENFGDRVYELVCQVPMGAVATYGQIAALAGSPRAARAVGGLMRSSLSIPREIPWHRIINAQGGISSRGDTSRAELQRRLLEAEGIEFNARGRCDLAMYRWEPKHGYWI